MQWVTLSYPAASTRNFNAGIVTSHPSIPNLLEVLNFVFKNKLKDSFSHKSSNIFSFLSLEVTKNSSFSI